MMFFENKESQPTPVKKADSLFLHKIVNLYQD